MKTIKLLHIANLQLGACISIKQDVESESLWFYRVVAETSARETTEMVGGWVNPSYLYNLPLIKNIIRDGLFPKQLFIDGEDILNDL